MQWRVFGSRLRVTQFSEGTRSITAVRAVSAYSTVEKVSANLMSLSPVAKLKISRKIQISTSKILRNYLCCAKLLLMNGNTIGF